MNAVWAIAATTVGEAIRRKVLLVILLVGILLLSIIPALSVLSARAEMSTTIATMFGALRMTSVLIAIVLTIYMIPNEIERRTIYTILSKPVMRWQFLVGKYLGAVLSLMMMIFLLSAVMIGLFWIFKSPDVGKLKEVAVQPIFYFMEMSLLAAVAMFFSTFTTPLVNFFLTAAIWFVGAMLNSFYTSIASNSHSLPFIRLVAKGANMILPNFANYDIKNPIVNPGQVIENPNLYMLYVIAYAVVYILVLLIGGMLIFDRREV